MIVELCQKGLDGLEMPVERALSIVVSILKGMCDMMNCSGQRPAELYGECYDGGGKVVGKVLHKVVTYNEM